ncbi:MAG: universal stress protein [Granulosicoccus sp.]
MSTTLVVGLDGESSGERALAYGIHMAELMKDAEILVVYVIEWSPFSFQTAEENAQRHKRREEEISMATERVVAPAVKNLTDKNITARGLVKHGDVADTLNAIAVEHKAQQIIVSRSSEGGFAKRIFGSSTGNLVMNATLPVTVVA